MLFSFSLPNLTLRSSPSSSSSFSSSFLRSLSVSFLPLFFLLLLLLLLPPFSSASLDVEQLCEMRCNIGRGGVLCKCNAFHFAGKRSEKHSSSSSSSTSSDNYWVDFIASAPFNSYHKNRDGRKYTNSPTEDYRKYVEERKYTKFPYNDNHQRKYTKYKKYTNSPYNNDEDDSTRPPASKVGSLQEWKRVNDRKYMTNNYFRNSEIPLSIGGVKRKYMHGRKNASQRRPASELTPPAALVGDRKYTDGRKFVNAGVGDDAALSAPLAEESTGGENIRGRREREKTWRREREGDEGRTGGRMPREKGEAEDGRGPLMATQDLLVSVLKRALGKRLIDVRRRESHSQTSTEEWIGKSDSGSFPLLALSNAPHRDLEEDDMK